MASLRDFKRRLPNHADGGVILEKKAVLIPDDENGGTKPSEGILCDWNGAIVKAHCLTKEEYVIVEVVDAPAHHRPAVMYQRRGERRQVLPSELEILPLSELAKRGERAKEAAARAELPFTRDELAKLSKDELLDLLAQKVES